MTFEDERNEVRAEYKAMFPNHWLTISNTRKGWLVMVREKTAQSHIVGDYETPYRNLPIDVDDFEQAIYSYVDTEVFTGDGVPFANLVISPMFADDVREVIKRLEKLIEGM